MAYQPQYSQEYLDMIERYKNPQYMGSTQDPYSGEYYQTQQPNVAGQIAKEGAKYGAKQGMEYLGIGGTGGAAASGAASAGGSSAIAAPQLISATRVPAAAAGGVPGAPAAGMGSYVGPAMAAAAIAHGGYGLSQNFGKRKPGRMAVAGAETGAGIGYFVGGPVGAGIGGGIGAITGGAAGMIKSGRHQDHEQRSNMRDQLAQTGFALRTDRLGGTLPSTAVQNPSGTYVPLADGSFYDISPERGSKQAYEVLDPNKPYSGMAIGWANPIAALATGYPNEKIVGDTAAQLSNGIMSNSGDDVEMMRANALSMFERLNMTKDQAMQRLAQLGQEGKLRPQEVAAFQNGLNTLFSGDGYTTNEQLAQAGVKFGEYQRPAAETAQPITPARGGVQGPMKLPNKGNQGAQPQGTLYAGPGSVQNLNPGMAAQASKATLPGQAPSQLSPQLAANIIARMQTQRR